MTISAPARVIHDALPSFDELPRNLLLAGLSSEALSLVQKHLREEELAPGAVLWTAADSAGSVFFPAPGLISIGVPTADGHRIEIAVVGSESAAGFFEESGMPHNTTEAVIHSSGRFLRLGSDVFAEAARRSAEIRHAGMLCKRWQMLQSQQIAACNAIHTADARLCCRLLRASDALADEIVPLTQDVLAQAIGIRRTTATLIAQRLQSQGMISYSRGKIVIRDRASLEAAACGCYDVFRRVNWPSELLRPIQIS
jgi:CRP-like cAMP-binding protein